MKVAVINNTAAGKCTEVHAAGCADVPKAAKRNRDDAWVFEAESQVDVSMTYWADIISDQVEPDSAEGWALAVNWLGEFNFLPCCKALPADHRAELEVVTLDGEEATVETTATPAATVTTWVGKAIAELAMATQDGTHNAVAAKLAEAKVTKAGDRTVKLTAEEAAELAAFATELEAKGGSIAYSARTLRARLS